SDGGALPAHRSRWTRDGARQVRASRVRREGEAKRTLAAPSCGAEPAGGGCGDLVMKNCCGKEKGVVSHFDQFLSNKTPNLFFFFSGLLAVMVSVTFRQAPRSVSRCGMRRWPTGR